VTKLWFGQQRIRGWISARDNNLYFWTLSILSVQSTQSIIQGEVGVILLLSKRPGRESDHIPSYNALYNTDRTTPLLTVFLHGAYTRNFTFEVQLV